MIHMRPIRSGSCWPSSSDSRDQACGPPLSSAILLPIPLTVMAVKGGGRVQNPLLLQVMSLACCRYTMSPVRRLGVACFGGLGVDNGGGSETGSRDLIG